MVGSVYIIMYIVREHPPKWLPVVLAVAVGSRGLVTLGVWLWTHNLSEVRTREWPRAAAFQASRTARWSAHCVFAAFRL